MAKTAGVSLPFDLICCENPHRNMKCKDIQFDLALYGDDVLSAESLSAIESHFESCPVCRAKNSANRDIRNELRFSPQPQMTDAITRSLRTAVSNEIRTGRKSTPWHSTAFGEWLQMSLMPYSVGVIASLIVAVSVLTIMFSDIRTREDLSATSRRSGFDTSIMLTGNQISFPSTRPGQFIDPAEYARMRSEVSNESPSLNPQGSLVSMTGSFVRKNMAKDGVVVVAEVFSNGLAQINEVVDPSRDKKAISDLEKALDADLGNAPFLPASLDNRSDSVRVVLRFQNVVVNTKENPRRRPGS